ncbi:MAG: TPM domain-containing protein [Elusimicrobia bacterium]|nr:TPM domain-containing protein [Elusimicrobiota bacterium]
MFRHFLTDDERKRIAAEIALLEAKTAGEIHVHVIGRAGKGDALELAKRTFFKLGLEKTDGRNGVLILISHLDHRFAIYGDEGIHARAGQKLWDKAAKTLTEHFAARRYPEGIEACVREVGQELARHFPKTDGPGKNQLSNEVTES